MRLFKKWRVGKANPNSDSDPLVLELMKKPNISQFGPSIIRCRNTVLQERVCVRIYGNINTAVKVNLNINIQTQVSSAEI